MNVPWPWQSGQFNPPEWHVRGNLLEGYQSDMVVMNVDGVDIPNGSSNVRVDLEDARGELGIMLLSSSGNFTFVPTRKNDLPDRIDVAVGVGQGGTGYLQDSVRIELPDAPSRMLHNSDSRPLIDYVGWFDDFSGISAGTTAPSLNLVRTNFATEIRATNSAGTFTGETFAGTVIWDQGNREPGSNYNGDGQTDAHGAGVSHSNRVPTWIVGLLELGSLDPPFAVDAYGSLPNQCENGISAAETRICKAFEIRDGLLRNMVGPTDGSEDFGFLREDTRGYVHVTNYLDGDDGAFRDYRNSFAATPSISRNAGSEGFLFPGYTKLLRVETADGRRAADLADRLLEQAIDWNLEGRSGAQPYDLSRFGTFSTMRNASQFGMAALSAALVELDF